MKAILMIMTLVFSVASFGQSAVVFEEMVTVKAKAHSVGVARHRAQNERNSLISRLEGKCAEQAGQLEVSMKWTTHRKISKRSFTATSRAKVVCLK